MKYKLQHEFFISLEECISKDPPNSIVINHLHNLGMEYYDLLKEKYTITLEPWLVTQSLTQLDAFISKVDMYGRWDVSKQHQIIARQQLRREELGTIRMPKNDLIELDKVEDRLLLWSELEGNLNYLHKLISDLVEKEVKNLPLPVIAGICFYKNVQITRKNERNILDSFNYKGKGTKLYLTYLSWVKERHTRGNLSNKKNYFKEIINYLEENKMYEEAKNAKTDLEKLNS